MPRFIYSFSLLLTVVTLPLSASTSVSQSLIDSLLDRAYYMLTSVDDPGSGMTREMAIASAKGMCAKLRSLAEEDLNRGYIIGKAKELETQIYLEEKGLLLEKDRFKQKNLNDLIASFNTELGKKRPALLQLYSYRDQMHALDARAGTDVDRSLKKRAASLAVEVPAALQAALEKGLIDSARSELVYCEVNRDYLGISAARYAALEAKVAGKMSDEGERALVIKSLDGLKAALEKGDLGTAGRENAFIERRLRPLRTRLLPYEWKGLNAECALYNRKFRAKEDSLVNTALSALKKNGAADAEQQLEALKTAGVSPERIGEVDRAILETVIKQKRLEPVKDSSLTIMEEDSREVGFALGDMVALAKKRAAEKKDSAKAAEDALARSTQVEEVRKERLRTAYALRELREKDKNMTEKEQALQELVDIYTFLELQKSKDAYQKLIYVKTLLQNNIPLEDYEKVTAAVEREYEKAKTK